MKDAPRIFVGGDVVGGRRLSDDTEQGGVGTVIGRPRVTQQRLTASASLWPRGNVRDFERRDGFWVDKASGTLYLPVDADPLLADDPRTVEVSLFLVTNDEHV